MNFTSRNFFQCLFEKLMCRTHFLEDTLPTNAFYTSLLPERKIFLTRAGDGSLQLVFNVETLELLFLCSYQSLYFGTYELYKI